MLKQGVLLVNLGSPASPSSPDVRRYLREFLMDPRVIDLPYPARFALVNGIIAPFRAGRSSEAYSKIWTEAGSPLVSISRRLAAQLEHQLGMRVGIAMRYGQPAIAGVLEKLSLDGVRQLVVIPLFPHYAMSSYESAVLKVRQAAAEITPWMSLTVVPPYFDDPDYVQALVAASGPYLSPDAHVLFSFHGVPERHIRKTDPSGCHCLQVPGCCETPSPARETCYRSQCLATLKAFASRAGLLPGTYSFSFQSRLGRDRWLAPATQDQLVHLARSGVRKLAVICPAFTVDCLETIEEIGIRGKEIFMAEGGAEFHLVPCLNDHPVWVKTLASLACRNGAVPMNTSLFSPEPIDVQKCVSS
jgi:protoporphyrin/coproporphyrin ferrochelatase